MSFSIRSIAIAVAIAAAIAGVKFWQSHLISKGDTQGAARVQHAWDTQENARNAATARDNVVAPSLTPDSYTRTAGGAVLEPSCSSLSHPG